MSALLKKATEKAQKQFNAARLVASVIEACSLEKTFPENRAAEVADKVKNRNRRRQRLCEVAAKRRYGVRPRNYLGYLDDPKERALAEAVLRASNNRISPEFLFTVAMGEGLNHYFDDGGQKARKGEAMVDGFKHIGLDQFGSDIEDLKKAGYLRGNFNEGDEYARKTSMLPLGEKGAGSKVPSATFKNLPVAMEAVSAELAWRQTKFVTDVMNILGEEHAKNLTAREIDYWTYIYFNAGPATGRKLLKLRKSAAIKKWRKDPQGEGGGYSTNAHSNALVRIATTDYLHCTEVFRSAYEQCSDPEYLFFMDR